MTTAPMPRHPRRPRRLASLSTAAVLLTAAALLLPFPLASAWAGGAYAGLPQLRQGVSEGLVRFWATGSAGLGADLELAAVFWGRFHVLKAGLAAVLTGILALLVARAWRAWADPGSRSRRLGLALLASSATTLFVVSVLALVANLQGAVAPLSSVLGVLPLGSPDATLRATVDGLQHAVATGAAPPAVEVLRQDFQRYHAAMAVLGALVTAGLLAGAVVAWRRRARTAPTDRSWRRLLAVAAIALVGVAGLFALVTVANVGTALHPTAAMLGFLAGGG